MKPRKPWPIQQMIDWYQSGMCLQEIADKLSSDDFQPYWKERLGEEYRPNQKMVNKTLNKHIQLRKRGAPGCRNGFWKNGRTIDKGGYVLIHMPEHPMADKHGRVREHRLVAEAKLGRHLTKSEVVHHIDEDPANNDHDNLMVYETNAKHISETTRGPKPNIAVGGRRRHFLRNHPEISEKFDSLIRRLHMQGLSLPQLADLFDSDHKTISRRMTKSGIVDRQSKSGTVTDEIREECRRFLASLTPSTADAPKSPESTDQMTA